MPRKTIAVGDVRDAANRMLAASPASDFPKNDVSENDKAQRMGIIILLESVLHNSDNYRGYRFQVSEWDGTAEKLRDGYDETRRIYM